MEKLGEGAFGMVSTTKQTNLQTNRPSWFALNTGWALVRLNYKILRGRHRQIDS